MSMNLRLIPCTFHNASRLTVLPPPIMNTSTSSIRSIDSATPSHRVKMAVRIVTPERV